MAFLRGTTADPEGNITMEREALTMEALAVATAVHNAGGLVIVQVERVADSGSLSPREVKIPAVLVDCVVVSQPGHHWQTFGTPYSAALSGDLRRVRNTVPPLELTARKVIARRAAMELRPDGHRQSRHRHAGRRRQRRRRRAIPGLPHPDRRAGCRWAACRPQGSLSARH